MPAGALSCLSSRFLASPAIHAAQSLRNHRVGNRCNSAFSGPRLTAVICTSSVFRTVFGVLHEDIKVAILIKHAGIEQFIFHFFSTAPPIRLDQVSVGIGGMRILVEILHVGMRRRAVEVEVVFFDILAMVAFAIGQSEQTFFQNGILPIPEGKRKTKPLLVVGESRQAIFAPAIGPRASLIMGEIVPGIPIGAIVFPHRAPLTFA